MSPSSHQSVKCGITDGDHSLYLHYQLHWCVNVFILSILFLSPFFLLTCGERLNWWRRMCRSPWQPLTPSSLSFLLHLLLCFFSSTTTPPAAAAAESGGCAFLGSSWGSAVDCASSSTLKSHLRFETMCWRYLICLISYYVYSEYRPWCCVDGVLWWALYRRTTGRWEM